MQPLADQPETKSNDLAKHTPGPWKEERASFIKRHAAEGLFIVGNDVFHSVVCEIREYLGDEQVESYANASLIAAAPELLSALTDIMLIAQSETTWLRASELEREGTRYGVYLSADTLDKALAAIAKAKGGR